MKKIKTGYIGKVILSALILLLVLLTYHSVTTYTAYKTVENKLGQMKSSDGNAIIVEKVGKKAVYKDSKTGKKVDSIYLDKEVYKVIENAKYKKEKVTQPTYIFTDVGLAYKDQKLNYFYYDFHYFYNQGTENLSEINLKDQIIINLFLGFIGLTGLYNLIGILVLFFAISYTIKDAMKHVVLEFVTGQVVGFTPKDDETIKEIASVTTPEEKKEIKKLVQQVINENVSFGLIFTLHVSAFFVILIEMSLNSLESLSLISTILIAIVLWVVAIKLLFAQVANGIINEFDGRDNKLKQFYSKLYENSIKKT